MLAELATKKAFIVEHKSEPTCAQCREYEPCGQRSLRGVCRLRASADWGDASFVRADKKACHFASILPF